MKKLLTGNSSVVYRIVNKSKPLFYIGSTKNFHKRRLEHLNDLLRNIHHCPSLQEDYNKGDEFDFEIVFENNLEDCRELEDLILKSFESVLYNTSKSAYGPCIPVDFNLREKHSKRFLNSKLNVGRKASEETKRKMREKRKGTSIPQKCIDKSFEVSAKPVFQYDLNMNFIKSYKSVTEAGKQFHTNGQKNISKCLSGAQKTAYKYIWKYQEKPERQEKIFNNKYLHLFITRYKTVSVKFCVDGEIHFLGTFDTQKEALEVRNNYIRKIGKEELLGIIEYKGE